MREIIICVVLLLLEVSPAHARWERVVASSKGGTSDFTNLQEGAPHPLKYFLTPSPQRDISNSLCWGCKSSSGAVSLQNFSMQTSKRLIGVSYGRKIFEIRLTFHQKEDQATSQSSAEDNSSDIVWKSIVMQTSGNLYRELYLIIDDGIYVRPLSQAEVLNVSGHHVLVTNDPLGGNGGYCSEGHWVLQPDGPWWLDFGPVYQAIEKLTPPHAAAMQTGCWALSLPKLELGSPVQKMNAACHACDYLGSVSVRFKIEGHRAIPVSSSFTPDAEN